MSAQNEKRIVDFVINGKTAEVSLSQIKKEVIALTREFSKLKEADDPMLYKKKAQELNRLSNVYKQMRAEINGARTESQKFFDQFKSIAAGVLGGNLIYAAWLKLNSTISDSIRKVKELDDSYSNIKKTTQLTAEQTKKLDDELGKLDTRTARSELREFAAEAGKQGMNTVESVKQWVEAADIINVALGEDLGKDAVLQIMKLADIFGDKALDIASAINSIGQASVATERFQVDFLSRTSGIANQLGITSNQLLGYGAALEMAGQTQEVSGTSFTQFLQLFTKNTEEFGRAAGMAKGELEKLVKNKDVNAGFIEFLSRFQASSAGAKDLLQKLDELNIDGIRGSSVLLSLSQNVSNVIEQQKIAAESTGSVLKEFIERNNNAAAQYEKSLKKIQAVITPILQNIGGFFIGITRYVADNISGIITLTKVLMLGVTAWGIYRGALIAASVAKSVFNKTIALGTTLQGFQRVSLIALAAAQALFSGNVTRATAAMRLFNATSALNPWGALVAIIGTAVTALALFGDKAEKVSVTQKALSDATNEAAKSVIHQKQELERNLKIARDVNQHQAVREAALKRMIDLNPTYLYGLSLENINTAEGRNILKGYNDELMRSAELKAKASKVDELESEIKDLRLKRQSDPASAATIGDRLSNAFAGAGGRFAGARATSRSNVASGMANIDAEIKAKQAAINKLNQDILNLQAKEKPRYTSEVTGETYTSEADLKKAEAAKLKADKALQKERKDEMDWEKTKREFFAEVDKERALEEEKAAKKSIELIENEFDLAIAYSERYFTTKQTMLDVSYAEGLLTAEQYEAEILKLEEAMLKDSLQLHEEYNKDLTEIVAKQAKIRVKTKQEAERSAASFSMVQPSGTFGSAGGAPGSSSSFNLTDFGDKEEVTPEMMRAEGFKLLESIMQTSHDKQMQRMEAEFDAFEAGQNRRRRVLDQQLSDGIISEQSYREQIEALDNAYAEKEKAFKQQQWQKRKKAAITEATIDGIVSVVKTLATYAYPYNLIMAALQGAVVAMQISALNNQQMPQFEEGGSTWVTGASDGRRYYAKRKRSFENGGRINGPTYGLIAEKGPEFVIPNYIYANPKYANVMGMLEAAVSNRQFYAGGSTATDAPVGGSAISTDLTALIANATMAIDALNTRLQKPIVAKTYFGMQEFHEADELYAMALENGKF